MSETIYIKNIDRFVVVFEEDGQLKKISFVKSDSKPKITIPKSKIAEDLKRYFEGYFIDFGRYMVDLSRFSDFERKVLDETRSIPYGKTVTYSEVAKRIKNEKAHRACGNALRKNPVPIVIPCHRVVSKNGIGGYSPGRDIKKKLLELEILGNQTLNIN